MTIRPGIAKLIAMCGRYSMLAELGDLAEQLQLTRLLVEPAPRYNIAPSYSGSSISPIARTGDDGKRELVPARWWFIPSWWQQPLNRLPTAFNARSEDLANKRFFKHSLVRRRCLVPASGWYEYKGARGKKEAYYFSQPQQPFAFAGLWDKWQSPEGEQVMSFAIITCEANELVRPIHPRMPIVLGQDSYDNWLDRSIEDPKRLAEILTAPSATELGVYRASGHGNNPRHDGPDCIAPWVEPEPTQGALF